MLARRNMLEVSTQGSALEEKDNNRGRATKNDFFTIVFLRLDE